MAAVQDSLQEMKKLRLSNRLMAFEGLTCSGKTTLIQEFSKVREDVISPELALVDEDRDSDFPFLRAELRRTKFIDDCLAKQKSVVSDRFFLSTIVVEGVKTNHTQLFRKRVYEMLESNLVRIPSTVVWLVTEPQTAYRRQFERNALLRREHSFSMKSLEQVSLLYNDFFTHLYPGNIIRLKTDPFRHTPEEYLDILFKELIKL